MPRRTRIHIDGLPLHIAHPGRRIALRASALRRSSVPALGVDPAILPNLRRQVMGYESLDGAQRNPGRPAAPSRATPMCPALPPDSAIAPSGLRWLGVDPAILPNLRRTRGKGAGKGAGLNFCPLPRPLTLQDHDAPWGPWSCLSSWPEYLRGMPNFQFTECFEREVLRKRPYLRKEWCIFVVENPARWEPR